MARPTGDQPLDPRPALGGVLGPRDIAVAERVAGRLRAELRTVLASLPADVRGASALARHLGIERTTCQRLVSALDQAPGVELLVRLPGLEGLRVLLDALRGAAVETEDLAACESAVEEFAQFLKRVGRSKAALGRILLAPAAQQVAPRTSRQAALRSHLEQRQAFHEAAADLAGRWSDLQSAIWCIGPSVDDPSRRVSVYLCGFIGHESRSVAMPLVVAQFGDLAREHDECAPAHIATSLDERAVAGASPNVLLEQFSSSPRPRITARQRASRVEYCVDTDDEHARGPFDVVLASRVSAFDTPEDDGDPPLLEVWSLSSYPARHLVFDVFLHRDLARTSIPSLSTHAWSSSLTAQRDRWSTRVPNPPRLQVLGSGRAAAACEAFPRQVELVGHALDSQGWRDQDFVGFRCEQSFPLWRIGYCMQFDFAPKSSADESPPPL
jgi:hypothetical protein